MAHAVVPGGIALEYETFGDPADPAILLIAGFGAQLLSWDSGFCLGLAQRGRFVIRFDNRDTGLSTKFDLRRPESGDRRSVWLRSSSDIERRSGTTSVGLALDGPEG